MVRFWWGPSSRFPASCCVLTCRRAERGNKVSHDSDKGTSSIHKGFTLMTSSNPNYFPKIVPPNPITWRGKVSTYTFSEDTNIQSISAGKFTLYSRYPGTQIR